MKVRIGIPCSGQIFAATVVSLLTEQDLFRAADVELEIEIIPGGGLTTARDQIACGFIDSEADRLVFLDADVSWEPGALLKLAMQPVDFVGGAYRHKQEKETYPVMQLQDRPELWADPKTGLLEVEQLPTGFMCLSRKVFLDIQARFPERAYEYWEHKLFGFFYFPPGGGEDGAFCLDWRRTGGKVWLDPELTLTHTGGTTPFVGHIGNYLKSLIPQQQKAA